MFLNKIQIKSKIDPTNFTEYISTNTESKTHINTLYVFVDVTLRQKNILYLLRDCIFPKMHPIFKSLFRLHHKKGPKQDIVVISLQNMAFFTLMVKCK